MKTIRIFISSTFRDMHSERDYLVKYVFPELRERCMKKNLYLVDVDLRWGVTQEEAEQGKALELCLDEIENCRPFFIGLLGERYGWTPEAYQLPDHPRFDWMKNFESGHSITALEIYQGVLNNPGMHTSAFFYFRDPAFQKDIPEEKQSDFCAEDEESATKLKRLKNEIRRVYKKYKLPGHITESYTCSYKGIKVDMKQLKKRQNLTENPDDIAVLKQALDENSILGKIAYEKLNGKQKRIATDNGTVVLGGLETFGHQVLNDIWQAIEKRYPDQEQETDPLIIENNYHENFLNQRTRFFTGRQNILKQILTSLQDHKIRKPLFVVGGSGSGKSALLSVVVKAYREQNPSAFTLARFVGASPDSQDVFRLVTEIVNQLENHFGIIHDPDRIKSHEKLWDYFRELLWKIGEHNPLLIVIDAVNQLHPSLEPHYLTWLPKYLPEKVKLLVSTTEGDYDKRAKQLDLPVISIKPLSKKDIRNIITYRLSEYRKKLSAEQMQMLLAKKESNKPLYLAVACEELRTFPQFEFISQRIAGLSDYIPDLFTEVLQRLEQDHGRQLVKDALCMIACSQQGLMEEELLELLAHPGKEKFPANTWARLYRDISLYLSNAGENKEGLIRFFHHQFSDAVRKCYLPNSKTEKPYYKRLADYGMAQFEKKPEVVGNCLRYLGVYLYQTKNETQIKKLLSDVFADDYDSVLIRGIIANVLFDYVVKNNDSQNGTFFKQIINGISKSQFSYCWSIFLASKGDEYKRKGFTAWAVELYDSMYVSFLSLSSENFSPSNLLGVALSLHNLADLYAVLGNSSKSFFLLQQSEEILNQLIAKDPFSLEYQKAKSVVCNSAGNIYKKHSNESIEALSYHTKAKQILENILFVQPNNVDAHRELAITLNYIGDIHAGTGDLSSARLYFEQMCHLLQNVSSENSDTPNLKSDYLSSLNNLGYIYLNEGKAIEGLDFMRKVDDLINSFSSYKDFDSDLDQVIAETNLILGNLFSLNEDYKKSITHFRKSCNLLENLLRMEPLRTDFKNGLASCYDNLGRTFLDSGEGNNALAAFQKSYDLTKELLKLEADRLDYLLAYCVANVELGKRYFKNNDKNMACKHFEEVLIYCNDNGIKKLQHNRLVEYYLLSLWFLHLLCPKRKSFGYIKRAYRHIKGNRIEEPEDNETRELMDLIESSYKKARRKPYLRIVYFLAFNFYITLFVYPIPNAKYSAGMLNFLFGLLHGFTFLSNWIISIFNSSRLKALSHLNPIYNATYILGVLIFAIWITILISKGFRQNFFSRTFKLL